LPFSPFGFGSSNPFFEGIWDEDRTAPSNPKGIEGDYILIIDAATPTKAMSATHLKIDGSNVMMQHQAVLI
jgi:hypothetical protein